MADSVTISFQVKVARKNSSSESSGTHLGMAIFINSNKNVKLRGGIFSVVKFSPSSSFYTLAVCYVLLI